MSEKIGKRKKERRSKIREKKSSRTFGNHGRFPKNIGYHSNEGTLPKAVARVNRRNLEDT